MLGDDIAGALPELRAQALSRMTSACTIRRLTGRTTQNEGNGREVPEWADKHVALPIRFVGGSTTTVTVGGVEYQEATGRADLPFDTTDLADDDLIDLTSGEWAGTVLRVVEAVKGDQRTARRVPVVEVARPKEWT